MIRTEIKQAELPNGLKILGEIIPTSQSATIGFFVKTGARDESEKESGVSHFLEHMVFKGTEKRSALDVTYQLADVGAQSNAYTSEETTVFYASVIPEFTTTVQELLSDMMRPALDNKEFDMEKKVILEEIALYQDRPTYYLFENALRDYFAGHAAGNSVLGTTQTITDLSRDQMWEYHQRRYAANNIVLAAAGNFDWDAFVDTAKRCCGDWKRGETPRTLSDHKRTPSVKSYTKPGLNRAHIMLITRGPNAQSEDRYAHNLLSYILGDSSGSKMYWELVHSGLAEAASAETDEKDGTGCFLAYAVCDPKDLSSVKDKMLKILSNPLDFTDADLARVKKKLASKLVLSGELPHGRAMNLGNSWLYKGKVTPLTETVEKIRSVTRADIERVVSSYPLKDFCEYSLIQG